jgi:arylsulfatase A
MGFDEYLLAEGPKIGGNDQQADYWDLSTWGNGQRVDLKGLFSPDVFNEAAIEFIDKHRDERFFLYYPLRFIHTPIISPPWDKNTGDDFFDMIAYTDQLVGNVIEHLEALSLMDNTLIIFTGDNGNMLSIQTMYQGELVTGGKSTLTEAGTRVPLIATLGNHGLQGRMRDELVDFTDFLPTFAHMAGLSDPQLDGTSFAHHVIGKDGPSRHWAYVNYAGKWIIHDRQWRLRSNGELLDISDRYNGQEIVDFDSTTIDVKGKLQRWANTLHSS